MKYKAKESTLIATEQRFKLLNAGEEIELPEKEFASLDQGTQKKLKAETKRKNANSNG